MKIAILSPYYAHTTRGNAVTARRIAKELQEAGCDVAVFAIDDSGTEPAVSELAAFAPDVIHCFHGYLGGVAARKAALRLAVPYIVTLTGTDVYEALTDWRKGETRAALAGAARLVAFHGSVRDHLARYLPEAAAKTVVIPQGVEVSGERELEATGAAPPGEAFTFFLPAGLRPVKNVLFPLAPLARLYREHPCFRFLLAGPVLDAGYASQVRQRLEDFPFAQYGGEIGRDTIGNVYRTCQVVLNTSHFEGGMANSVLEALALGKPVLASDIEGNRSVVEDEETGLLYSNEEEFYLQARRLLADPALRQRLGENGRRMIFERHAPGKEGRSYLELYQSVLAEATQ